MTSTSIATLGGVVVVTQVIPQDEKAIPLQTPATAPQAPPPATKAPPPSPAKMNDMTRTFLRGEPLGLGVVQISVGLLCILFSLTAAYSPILMVHAPLCLAVAFVVSGSLAVAAARRTSVTLVWASLVWNLISVVLGLVGVAYVCWLLADRPPSERFCGTKTVGQFVSTNYECINTIWILNVCVYGLLGLVLVLLVLQVCVAVTVCVFSGKAIRRRDRRPPITVEVHDGSALLSGAASQLGSDVDLLDSED
ncbi:membrane-spanning 4-domains subfamily A member 4A isoform X1 [Siniperca chuatsi]|uniref:membrane-spanning 4-domains subfamily A member 4A isoform X1 n=1 Tax=Siniperca chuatsi TaxID=119488 RepID=UPI001CE09DAB|nr:membrane-spanning 4-domains subfamily A member 4A isoform X1 [Siniperca chuatsi]